MIYVRFFSVTYATSSDIYPRQKIPYTIKNDPDLIYSQFQFQISIFPISICSKTVNQTQDEPISQFLTGRRTMRSVHPECGRRSAIPNSVRDATRRGGARQDPFRHLKVLSLVRSTTGFKGQRPLFSPIIAPPGAIISAC